MARSRPNLQYGIVNSAIPPRALQGSFAWVNSPLATSSFIDKSFQCFANLQRLGPKAASFGSVVNRPERELMFYGPGTERAMFAEEFCPEVRVLFVCYPLHTV